MVYTPIRVAQTIGITTAGFTAGTSFALSYFVMPRLLESPTPLLLKQWKASLQSGGALIVPITGVSSLSFFYLAYKAYYHRAISASWEWYTTAGVLASGIILYTRLIMMDTNRKLLAKADETSALGISDTVVEIGMGGETAHQLVDRWASLNLGRSVMLTLATVVGSWAALA